MEHIGLVASGATRDSQSSPEMKRMSFLISAAAHRELIRLSRDFNETMTGLIRIGLALARIALEARRCGERIVVVGPDGTPRKELVLPLS
jgi:hypothetical protein